MRRSDLLKLAVALAGSALAACAQVLGADFDVELAAAGGGGSGPVVEVIAKDEWPFGIAVDDTYVYWTSGSSEGAVRRAKKEPNASVETLAPKGLTPNRILLLDDYVYWTDNGDGTETGGVYRVKKAGGSAPEPIAVPSNRSVGLATDGARVFFTSLDPAPAPAGYTTLYAYDPGTPDDPPAAFLYAPNPVLLAVRNGVLWGSGTDLDLVFRADLADGPFAPYDTFDLTAPNGIAIAPDGAAVVGQYASEAAIFRLPPGDSIQRLYTGLSFVGEVLATDDAIYWTATADGRVERGDPTGAEATDLAGAQPNANGLALDAGYLYFTRYSSEADGGSVQRVALP
jgi:hypothetical protein